MWLLGAVVMCMQCWLQQALLANYSGFIFDQSVQVSSVSSEKGQVWVGLGCSSSERRLRHG
jgi:hypothetical protein